jgi:Flp pilus assembly protein TadG
MRVRLWTRPFADAKSGNVAMMWALLASFLVGLTGLTVDFTRAQMLRAQLQNAADGAALVAARGDVMTEAQRHAAARAFFDAEMGDIASTASFELTELPDGEVSVSVSMPMPLSLARLVRDEDWMLHVESDAERSGVNVEVALVLDTTGSMAGQRLTDLKAAATELVTTVVRPEQEPYYSKMALVTYSTGVNLGSYATQARGPITPGRSLSNTPLNWLETTSHNITGIAKAGTCTTSSCNLTVTSNNHGYQDGDRVYISGVNGMTQVNNTVFIISNSNTNTFRLRTFPGNANVNGRSYGNYTSGGTLRECRTTGCEVVFTSSNHGFAANEYIYVAGVGGMSASNGGQAINNPNPVGSNNPTLWRVGSVLDANTFTLQNSFALNYAAYTSGGTARCLAQGCEYFRFTNTSGNARVLPITNCASERTGAERYTDAAPSVSYVGRAYAGNSATCPSNVILPLTTDTATLTSRINGTSAAGYTAGHIGLAWGWYMIAPDFATLWPEPNRPAAYGEPQTVKIVVLMTDGEFNTGYCNDVISSNSGVGGSDRINCATTNGSPYTQAESLCTAMKNAGIIIYTVGFQLGADQNTQDLMNDCASSPSHAYLSSDGDELRTAFASIAASITQLRLTR